MNTRLNLRDVWAGLAVAAFGLVAVVDGSTHNVGTLVRMGTGYMPVVLGILLILLGGAITAGGLLQRNTASLDDSAPVIVRTDWRGFGCIIGGLVVFVLVGGLFGFAPATFLLVLISAFADRDTTMRGAVALAVVMTAVVVLLFGRLLQIPFPVLTW